MNEQRLAETIDLCLKALARGDSLEACLFRFQDQRQELEPLLRAALQLQGARVINAPAAFRSAARERLVTTMTAPAPQRERLGDRVQTWFTAAAAALHGPLRAPALARTALIVLALLLGVTATSAAAQSALPGSPLYAAKQLGEQVHVRLATDPGQVRLGQAQRRLEEAAKLQDQQRNEDVTAVLQDFETALGDWKQRRQVEAPLNAAERARLLAQLRLLDALAAGGAPEQQAMIERGRTTARQALATGEETELPIPTVTPSPTATATPTTGDRQQTAVTPAEADQPQAAATPTADDQPQTTATPAAADRPQATATQVTKPEGPRPSRTPHSEPSRTPETPSPGGTPPAPPQPTPPGDGGPGPDGPDPDGPGPDDGPGPGPGEGGPAGDHESTPPADGGPGPAGPDGQSPGNDQPPEGDREGRR